MQKAVSVRIDDELYKECRKKLVDDDKTFTEFVKIAIDLYLKGELKLPQKDEKK